MPDACLQKAQLEDEVARQQHENEQLQSELQAMRAELQAQLDLHAKFESKLASQTEASNLEIKTLHDQVAAATRKRDGSLADEREQWIEELEAKLADAERSLKVLAAEKVQLLEAIELLEEDTGRLIDDAVAKHQSRIDKLDQELKVHSTWHLMQCCCQQPCLSFGSALQQSQISCIFLVFGSNCRRLHQRVSRAASTAIVCR
jgi:chromosome segregation ATPase